VDDLQPELETRLVTGDDRAVLHARGEVDLYSAGDFATALEDAATSAPHLVVDLTGVRFMDSTGLRALLQAQRRSDDAGSRLELAVDPSGPVARLLELAGVSDLFEVTKTRPEQD
jgi:anti-sigma B factor antagonist